MRRAWHLVTVAFFALGPVLVFQSPAFAPCHNFSVTASPSTVTEGGKVTVTVTRPGAAPSQINLDTIDETAKAGNDYKALHEVVQFTDSQSSKKYSLSTIDDRVHESTETFRIQLSKPSGCSGFSFNVGPPARVTIRDNDPAPVHSVTASKGATTTKTATASASTTPSQSKSASPTESIRPQTSSPSPTSRAAAARKGGGISGGTIAAIVVAGVLITAIAYGLLRRRRTT